MGKSCAAFAVLSLAAFVTSAQTLPAGKTLAATIEVFVFPANGQVAEQQSKDEVECYGWAASSTGNDPFELQKQAAAQQQQTQQQVEQARASTRGAGGRGAAGGLVAGALIGEIANDDAGEGAAWGMVLGARSARRNAEARSRQAEAQAQQGGAANQQATAQDIENFKKAMSVCLEAKQYMVKY